MGSSWSGFLPQNDIIKLQWAVLEGCQTDVAAKALSALLGKSAAVAESQNGEDQDESSWNCGEFGIRHTNSK
jgi:tetrahydromethanopterin S-methyltransferase subunit C